MKTIEKMNYEEKELNAPNGWAVLFITIILYIAAIFGVVYCSAHTNEYSFGVYDIEMIICIIWLCIGWFPLIGLRIIKPNEALVLTLFGKYIGTIKHEGFFFVNIFSVPVTTKSQSGGKPGMPRPKVSLKAMTHDNRKQKINDQMGNPIEVGIVVIWRVTNTAKALFNVDDYEDFLSIQADSTLRDVVRSSHSPGCTCSCTSHRTCLSARSSGSVLVSPLSSSPTGSPIRSGKTSPAQRHKIRSARKISGRIYFSY
mgnify:CR=1 FL=1